MTEMEQTFDLGIVGAGPAGTYLALRAAGQGKKVLLFDPKAPWEKPCGGGITHKAWSRFPILADPGIERNESLSSIQISPSGRFFVIDQGPPLLMVSRQSLGRVMLEAAINAGAVHRPLAVKKVEKSGTFTRLMTEQGDFAVRFVVGADGVHSVVRKAFLGSLPGDRTLAAVSQFYEGGPGDPTMIRVTPFSGYAWAFPRKNCLAVGVGAMGPGPDLKAELVRFTQEFFPERKPLGGVQGAVLPYLKNWAAYRERRIGAGWALIGDAAGFCDTLTGEGILYAVWSADLLADAYLNGNLRSYEKAWRKAFGPHLLAGALAAHRLYSAKNVDLFFTALTVCPSFHKVFAEYVWNLPSYVFLLRRFLAALPRALCEWRQFKKSGGDIDPSRLGEFSALADKVNFHWE